MNRNQLGSILQLAENAKDALKDSITHVKQMQSSKDNRIIVVICAMLVTCAAVCTGYALITKDATPLIFISILCSGVFIYAILELNHLIVKVEKEFREYVDAVDTIFKAIHLLERDTITPETLDLIKKAIQSANKEKADVEALLSRADTLQSEIWTPSTVGLSREVPQESKPILQTRRMAESTSQSNIIPVEDNSIRV